MKKVAILIVLVCASVASAGDITFWALGEQAIIEPTDGIVMRLGWLNENIEFGLQTVFLPDVEPEMPEVYGLYGVAFLEPIEVNNPIPLEILPEVISANLYMGGQISLDFGEDDVGSYAGLIAGTILNDVLVIEYQYNRLGDELAAALDPDAHSLYLGLRIKF